MITHLRQSLKKGWDSVLGFNGAHGPALTAAVQSKLSWATPIDSYEEAPPIYRPFLDRLLAGEADFPHALLTPTFRGYMREEKEKLVCVTRSDVYIVEAAKTGLAVTRFAGDDIHLVERGAVLLYAWLTIRGRTDQGALAASTLKFNAVTGSLFEPILDMVRRKEAATESTDLRTEMAKYHSLRDVNFKFMNYARRTVAPGETASDIILQPEIRLELLRIFGRSLSKTDTPAHLSILTNKEMIDIRDDVERGDPDAHYGGIWTYVPRDLIRATSLMDKSSGAFVLSVHLPLEDRVDFRYATAQRAEVESLVASLDRPRLN